MTVPVSEFRIPGSDGLPIAAYRWDAPDAPRAVVHLAHGVGEHVRRGGYTRLAEALVARGFAVQAHDHRGHGATSSSVQAQGEIGEGGWDRLVDDMGVLIDRAHADHPGLPVILFAHSMGSFAAQQWVLEHSDAIDGLVLSGTGALDMLEPALDLSAALDLSGFNGPFDPGRTGFEWLSRDEHEVDLYVADAGCGFGFDIPGTRGMFAGARALADPARMAGIRDDLPVHITVGEHDPVNAGLALVHPLVDRLRAAGVRDVTLQVWPGARHEVLNETNRDEVVADVVTWIEKIL